MSAIFRTILELPGVDHEGRVELPASTEGRWKKLFLKLVGGGKHSLACHVYSKRWAGGAYELAVRWSNGLVRKDGTGFCGRIFFDALSIVVAGDEDLVILPELRKGLFVRPDGERAFVAHGGGHYFPPRGVLERRFLLVPRAMAASEVKKLRDDALGFKAVKIPSPGRQPWGPARERMPIVNEAHYGNLFRAGVAQAQNLLASGQPGSVRLGPSGTWAVLDLRVGALGPHIVDGDPQAGAPAGYKVNMSEGEYQCAEALEFASMGHECSVARNPIAWNDLDTGEQLSCHDWPSSEIGRPVTTARGLIMPAFLDAQKNNYPSLNAGSCPYMMHLEGYAAEDSEHSERGWTYAKRLAFAAGDAMALDDIKMFYAHHKAMILNDRADARPRPNGSVSWNGYQSLTRDLAELAQRPHKGSARFLRQWGWTLDLGVSCSDHNFCRSMIRAYLDAVDTCGIAFREWHPPYLPPGVLGAQMFHNAIDQAAVLRACRLLNDPITTVRVLDTIRTWVKKVILNQDCRDAKWVHRQRPDGSEIDPIGPNDHGPEKMVEHILCVLGLAALCEHDNDNRNAALDFLYAGLTVGVPHGNLAQRYAWLQAQTADLSQFASYQAALEAYGV